MIFLVHRLIQWCCHCGPRLIFIIFTNSFDSISVQNMMLLLLLLIKTHVTWFMLIHTGTLCDRASLNYEFTEFLDSVHFMKQPKSTTELSYHMSKKKLTAQTLQVNVTVDCYAEGVEVKRQ